MKHGAYILVDLQGVDLETGITLPHLVGNKQVMLMSGVQIQDVVLPDFFFHGTTSDGDTYTQNNLYLNYYISFDITTGFIQVATTEE